MPLLQWLPHSYVGPSQLHRIIIRGTMKCPGHWQLIWLTVQYFHQGNIPRFATEAKVRVLGGFRGWRGSGIDLAVEVEEGGEPTDWGLFGKFLEFFFCCCLPHSHFRFLTSLHNFRISLQLIHELEFDLICSEWKIELQNRRNLLNRINIQSRNNYSINRLLKTILIIHLCIKKILKIHQYSLV